MTLCPPRVATTPADSVGYRSDGPSRRHTWRRARSLRGQFPSTVMAGRQRAPSVALNPHQNWTGSRPEPGHHAETVRPRSGRGTISTSRFVATGPRNKTRPRCGRERIPASRLVISAARNKTRPRCGHGRSRDLERRAHRPALGAPSRPPRTEQKPVAVRLLTPAVSTYPHPHL